MNKPKNLKQRTAADTMKVLKNAGLDSFADIEARGWAKVRALNSSNSTIILDWRIQWGDTDKEKQNRQEQLFTLRLNNVNKNDELVISRQELERILRHI